MAYVETIDLNEIPLEKIPSWFEGQEEITDEELEQEFWKEIETDPEIENIEQYDSIIAKLRANIRNHTQSFYEESKGLGDSFIFNYNNNGRDYRETMAHGDFGEDDKIYNGSLVLHNGDDDDDFDEEEDINKPFFDESF
uniref:Uncharacterized protein n=1 Tax=Euplotes harpa TaxID=151035 RepID=A0A7S3JL34_9SPIT|mmetsp:Transcript_7324/g.8290  ORF Transcript_7324/g.8290 Transcript_7324/m.8290 type:complete len:139 (+) Transcript_7324:220-636(+)